MGKRTCLNCGNIVLIKVCEHCGFEMPDLPEPKPKKTTILKEIPDQEERYEIIKAKPRVKLKPKKKSVLQNEIKTYSSNLTIPLNKVHLFSQTQNHLRKYINFKPYSYKTLFQKMEFIKFTLTPVEYITFSLEQEFRYRNKQEFYDMSYDEAMGLLYRDKMQIYENPPFTQPLDDTISFLKSINTKYTIGNVSRNKDNENTLKKTIRDSATKIIDYVGENGHYYEKKLIPKLSRITIHERGMVYLWNCYISTQFKNKSELKVRITDGKINPAGSFAQKKVTCKVCKKFEAPLHKKVCSLCKNNLCYDCAEEKTIFKFFKRNYCPKCVDSGVEMDEKKIKRGFLVSLVLGTSIVFLMLGAIIVSVVFG